MKTGSKACVVLSLVALAGAAGCGSSKKVSWADGANESGSSAAPGHVTPRSRATIAPDATASTPTGSTASAAVDNTAETSGPSADDSSGLGTNVREFAQSINVSRVSFAEEGADFDPSVSRDG